MLKKYIAISLLFFSTFMLVGHSVIPHHHHDAKDLTHQHEHHDSDGDNEHKGWGHLFSHLNHGGNDLVYTIPHFKSDISVKIFKVFSGTPADNFNLTEQEHVYKRLKIPDKRTFNISSIFLYSSGLRAPPVV